MTHSFDFAGVSEKLFLLEQLQAASREYCRNYGICQGSHPYGHDDWNDYEHKIKQIVSGFMIEIAAKLRILQDTLSGQLDAAVFRRADKYALDDIPLGKVHLGSFELSVREACNKIIHATKVELDWIARNRKTHNEYTYWSGAINLFGTKASKKWHLEINVAAWCASVETYIDHIVTNAARDGIHIA